MIYNIAFQERRQVVVGPFVARFYGQAANWVSEYSRANGRRTAQNPNTTWSYWFALVQEWDPKVDLI